MNRHIQREMEFDGKRYTYRQLSEMSGLCMSTLWSRRRKNPNATLEEMIAPKQVESVNALPVTINGVTKPLYQWSKIAGVDYDTIYHRWKRGLRGEELLVKPKRRRNANRGMKPILTQENIDWLLDTRKARKGQWNEWEIACELVGGDPSWADWLKEEFERRGLV